MRKMRIAVLYTGGTIGMQAGESGLRPSADTVLLALAAYHMQADFDITVCEPLIDSSQVTPLHWCEWQQWMLKKKRAHGILILHGTDSMAYSANVLAFALGQWTQPVVMTGSQKPLGTNGDAEGNLQAAVEALLQKVAPPGVSLVFDQKLWTAVGCRKVSTQSFDGFANKHSRPMALFDRGLWYLQPVQEDLELFPLPMWHGTRLVNYQIKRSEWFVFTDVNPNIRIASHYCVPVSQQWALRALLASDVDAVIIQSFGHGNGLFSQEDIAAMQWFQARGGVLVNVSQVFDGHVAAQYEASQALHAIGVFAAAAWTVETAYAKLLVGLSAGLKGKALQSYLQLDVLGELDSWEYKEESKKHR